MPRSAASIPENNKIDQNGADRCNNEVLNHLPPAPVCNIDPGKYRHIANHNSLTDAKT